MAQGDGGPGTRSRAATVFNAVLQDVALPRPCPALNDLQPIITDRMIERLALTRPVQVHTGSIAKYPTRARVPGDGQDVQA
jgi:hypothetical protein